MLVNLPAVNGDILLANPIADGMTRSGITTVFLVAGSHLLEQFAT